jgi:hypothetical protein
MDDRWTRALGATAGVGAVLTVVTAVPSRWYGVRETDAHLFDPAMMSPLWIERTLVPVASLVAVAMLVAGLAGLVARDRGVTGRLRRWGGYAALAGMVLLWFAMFAFTVGESASRGGSELVSVLLVLGGGLGVVASLVLLVPGLIATGAGYVRVDRPVVGYALAGGAGLSFLVTGFFWIADHPPGLGFLPGVVPFAAAFAGVAHELWIHPEPIPEPVADEEPTPGRAGTERANSAGASDDDGSLAVDPLDDVSAGETAPDDGDDERTPTDDGDDERTPTDDGDDERTPTDDGDDERTPTDDGDDERTPTDDGDGPDEADEDPTGRT